jgi:hypothetical protein
MSLGCATWRHDPARYGKLRLDVQGHAVDPAHVAANNAVKRAAYAAFLGGGEYTAERSGYGIDAPFADRIVVRGGTVTMVEDYTHDRTTRAGVVTYRVDRLELGWIRDGQFVAERPDNPAPAGAELFVRYTVPSRGESVF